MIAITFALPAESSGVKRLLKNCVRVAVGKSISLQGELRGKRVTIFHTGVGEKACRKRMQAFFETERFTSLISAGFAGALVEDLRVGDLFVPENFTSPDLLAASRQILAASQPRFGILTTIPAMIDGAHAREELRARNGAIAVDMETKFIAQACTERGIPFFSLRAITDTPTEPFPAPSQILFSLERQRTELGRLALYSLRHPAVVVRLLRFARRISGARQKLTGAIDALVGSDLF